MSTGTFKLQGQTNADAAIATVSGVTAKATGEWTWTIDGVAHTYAGNNAAVNQLLRKLFTGTGGFAAGTKLFGSV